MATLTASKFLSKCTYTKPEYEPRFFATTQIVACPALKLNNSVDSLQVRTCAVSPTAKNPKQSACDDNFEKIMHTLRGMKIIFVSAEMAPWSKTGGLGDVLGGLPPALVVIFSDSTSDLLFISNRDIIENATEIRSNIFGLSLSLPLFFKSQAPHL
jgi:Starch synthase catalytic domain